MFISFAARIQSISKGKFCGGRNIVRGIGLTVFFLRQG